MILQLRRTCIFWVKQFDKEDHLACVKLLVHALCICSFSDVGKREGGNERHYSDS